MTLKSGSDEGGGRTGRSVEKVGAAAGTKKSSLWDLTPTHRVKKKNEKKGRQTTNSDCTGTTMKPRFLIRRQGRNSLPFHNKKEHANKDLSHQDWYHGAMPRETVEELLTEDGDFLVRLSSAKTAHDDSDIKTNYVLTARAQGHTKHFIIVQTEKGKFTLKKDEFSSIADLVAHYKLSGKPLTPECHSVIKKPVLRPRFLLRDRHLQVGKSTLGHGHFGMVCVGTLEEEEGSTEVVIKKTKARMTDEERKEMVAEAMMMLDNAHENVVECKGIAADTLPISLVMERCACDLMSHVRKGDRKVVDKMGWCVEAACGFAFLSERGVIHRDIAARNCLLDHSGVASFVLKISDFGLARMADKKGEYRVTGNVSGIPVKWAAPEVFTGVFSAKSDVWAFGVLIWEVFTNGEKPYDDVVDRGPRMVEAVRDRIRHGHTLVFPTTVNARVREVGKRCWAPDPRNRPDFPALRESLRIIQEDYADTSPDNTAPSTVKH